MMNKKLFELLTTMAMRISNLEKQANVYPDLKAKKIAEINENGEIIKEYPSLTNFAKTHNCSVVNVHKAIERGGLCKGKKLIRL